MIPTAAKESQQPRGRHCVVAAAMTGWTWWEPPPVLLHRQRSWAGMGRHGESEIGVYEMV